MAIVPLLRAQDVEPQFQGLLARPVNLFRALINAPEGLARFHSMAEWIRWECSVDPRLRELAILQVGYLTGDAYEWSHHVELSRQFGVTDEDIQGIIDLGSGNPSALGELEQLVLAAASQLTRSQRMTDQVTQQLLDEFSPQQLTELVLVIAFYSMVVRVLGGLRIEVEPEYQEHLERFPLPAEDADPPAGLRASGQGVRS